MEKFYGNYLGLCINNADPEQRGRVQIFIPHIMPALYERWNQAGVDRKIEIIGNNLEDALPQEDVEQLKLMLPWSEAASPIFGNSVAGHYNPQTGNFNQSYGTENEALAGPNPSAINSGAISLNANGTVNKGEFLGFLEREVARSSLNNFVPSDGARFGIDGSPRSWANYFFHLANRESGFNTNTVGDIGRFAGNSNGLFQLSPNDAVNYGLNGGRPFSQQQLTDPVTNTQAAIAITSRLVRQDGAIGSDSRTGAARYWGPLRRGWTPPASSFSLNDPSAGILPGSSNPAQPSPFLSTEPKPFTLTEPSPDAVLTTQSPTRAPSSGINDLVNIAENNVGNIYGTSFGGKCHKATRGLVSAALGIPGHFGAGVAGAKYAIGTNYWTKGGYYEVLLPSGSNKTGYQPQEGDIAVTTGGKWGHVKAVIGGRFRSDNLNDSAANVLNGSAEIYRLTPEGKAAWDPAFQGLIGQTITDDIANNAAVDGTSTAGDDILAGGMVRNPTSTQPTVTDTTGMPQGLFSVPNPGAMLWVFFREGDPLYPVYFAASYGAREWNNAYKGASPKAHYPGEGDTTPRNQAIFRPNQAGGLTFTDTITDEEDTRSIRMFHANGTHLEMHLNGSTFYSPNEHIQQVAGNHYNSCLNRESWTQGTSNSVTIGDRITIVGNISQEAMSTIEEHAQIVKDINKNMLKGESSTA